MKEVCVGGYIGSSKVLGGCSAVGVSFLGQWWRKGSAESEGRLKVPHVDNVQRKFKNQNQKLSKLTVGLNLKSK